MEDIVKRLLAFEPARVRNLVESTRKICRDAALEIDILRRECDRLRAELCPPAHPDSPLQRAFESMPPVRR